MATNTYITARTGAENNPPMMGMGSPIVTTEREPPRLEEEGARGATAAPRSAAASARVAVNRAAGVAAPDRAVRVP